MGRRNEIDEAHRIFTVVKILCETVMMDMCYYTLVQTHGMYNTKSEH